MAEIINGQTTITVGQKKATNFARESFDDNETVTLTDTTATETQILRQVLRVKLMGNVVFGMIMYNSMTSEDLELPDVEEMVTVSKAQLGVLTNKIQELTEEELPNKAILIEHVRVTNGIIEDIEEQF